MTSSSVANELIDFQSLSQKKSKTMQQLLAEHVADVPLTEACIKVAEKEPAAGLVITQLIEYFTKQTNFNAMHQQNEKSKKRKLETAQSGQSNGSAVKCKLLDISCQAPRKKCHILLFENHLELVSSNSNADNAEIIEAFLSYADITHVLILPTPSKAVPYSTVVLLSNTGSHVMFNYATKSNSRLSFESDVTEIAEMKKMQVVDNDDLLCRIIRLIVPSINIVIPDKSDFESRFPITHGVGAKSRETLQLYSTCYMKAKEGQLYFLDCGIFFGLKKPFFLLEKERIKIVNIQNLTTRTFNLLIEYAPNEQEIQQIQSVFGLKKSQTEVLLEFDMIDHCEFEPIMQYLKKYSLDQISFAGMSSNDQDSVSNESGDDEQAPAFPNEEEYNESEDEDFSPDHNSGTDMSSEDDDSSSNSDITIDEDGDETSDDDSQ